MTQKAMTVLDVLQSTTAYFKKREIENPRLNAEHLVAHAVDLKRLELYLQFERVLTESELEPLRELVRRRGQGEPLQHLARYGGILRHTLFFATNARSFRALKRSSSWKCWRSEIGNAEIRILDVGTGSGVIALSLAMQFPDSEVVATDVSEEALALAHENATRLGIDRLRFVKSDLLQNVEGKFDLIVANLPYIATGERSALSREVLHDPEIALFAGEKGTN